MSVQNEILISVIIPVYNGEAFIDRAVQSVLCQMDGSIELILVNDGSKDNSGEICDKYAAKNANIQVIHKENGGISSARNAGILAAKGMYISFLDADDYVEADTYGKICEVITSHHPDCIDFGWRYISNGTPMPPAFHKLPKNTLLGENVLIEKILPPLLNLCNDPDHFIFDFSCTKVFLRNIINQNHILFDESRRIWEDRPFVAHYLRYCKNYFTMDRCFYNYVDVPGSLSRRYSMAFFKIILANFQHYRMLFGDQFDFDTQYVNDYWCHAIENMIFRSLEQKENTEQIRQNILLTLADPQVVHWYANRNPQNAFEKKMSRLVIDNQVYKALDGYTRHFKVKQHRQVFSKYTDLAKRTLKKCLSK